jgi:hypothetical protein
VFFKLIPAVLFFALFAGQIQASEKGEYRVTREKAGEIVLHGPDCAALTRSLEAIIQWAKLIDDGVFRTSFLPLIKREKDGCRAEIGDLLPAKIAAVLGRKPARDYYNCFGSCLAATGLSRGFRYASDIEIHFWLMSGRCNPVRSGGSIASGDLMIISEVSGEKHLVPEIHAAVYISPELVFTKNGYGTDSRWNLLGPDDVLSQYGVDKECKDLPFGPTDAMSKQCPRWVSTVRCDKQSALALWDQRLEGASAQLDEVEDRVADCATKDGSRLPLGRKEIGHLEAIAKTVDSVSIAEMARLDSLPPVDRYSRENTDDFLGWSGLAHRTESLLTQLDGWRKRFWLP